MGKSKNKTKGRTRKLKRPSKKKGKVVTNNVEYETPIFEPPLTPSIPPLELVNRYADNLEILLPKMREGETALDTLAKFLTDDFAPLEKKNKEVLTQFFVEVQYKLAQEFTEEQAIQITERIFPSLDIYLSRYQPIEELDTMTRLLYRMDSAQLIEKKKNARRIGLYKTVAIVLGSPLTHAEIELLFDNLSKENIQSIFMPRYMAKMMKLSIAPKKGSKSTEPEIDMEEWLESMLPITMQEDDTSDIGLLEETESEKKARRKEALSETSRALGRLLETDSKWFPDKASEIEEIRTQVEAARDAEDLEEVFRLTEKWLADVRGRLEELPDEKVECYERHLDWLRFCLLKAVKKMDDAFERRLSERGIQPAGVEFQLDFQEAIRKMEDNIAAAQEKTERIKQSQTADQLVELLLEPLPQFEEDLQDYE